MLGAKLSKAQGNIYPVGSFFDVLDTGKGVKSFGQLSALPSSELQT
jgi:hypothetical protein